MMREIMAMAVKDLRLLFRDRAGFFFTLFFPLIVAVMFGTIFGGGGSRSAMTILVVDEDTTDGSRAFVTALDSASEVRIEETNREQATELVRRGKRVAYVALKEGFGEAYERVFWGEPPAVELGVDPARQAEAAMLQGILMKYGAERMQRIFSDAGAQRDQIERARTYLDGSTDIPPEVRSNLQQLYGAWENLIDESDTAQESDSGSGSQSGFQGFEPIRIEQADVAVIREGPRSSYEITFPQGVIWGLIGIAAAFGLSIVTERTRGTLVRLQMAPIRRAHIMAGKAVACFMTTMVISVGLFIFGMIVFGIQPGSLLMLLLAIVSSSLAFVGIMMLLSVLGKTEQATAGISWAVLLIIAMLGGGMVPLFFMPSWMQTIGVFSPVKWAILAMEGAIWRQFTLSEMLMPCLILIGLGFICFTIGIRAFRWSQEL
jgi:ABC-2 type transport system permease protein